MSDATFTELPQLLRACLDDAVHELFASYGHPVAPLALGESLISTGEAVASSIAFSQPLVSGSLTVIGTGHVVRQLLAATGVDLSSIPSLSDATGELNNMLIGRLKNKCCRYGLALQLGTPTTFHTLGVQLAPSSAWLGFSAIGDRFFVRLEALLAHGAEPPAAFEPDPAADVGVEGDVILFE